MTGEYTFAIIYPNRCEGALVVARVLSARVRSPRRRRTSVWDDRRLVRLKLWLVLGLYLCAAVVSRG